MKKYIGILIVVLGIIIDQVTKVLAYNNSVNLVIIPNFLNFTLVENRGAAFGIAQGANLVLAIVSAIICLLILGVIIYSIYKKEDIFLFMRSPNPSILLSISHFLKTRKLSVTTSQALLSNSMLFISKMILIIYRNPSIAVLFNTGTGSFPGKVILG